MRWPYLTTTWSVPAGASWLLAALIGVVLATIVGLGLGFVALRFRGHYLATATLAFGVIFYGIVHEAPQLGARLRNHRRSVRAARRVADLRATRRTGCHGHWSSSSPCSPRTC